MGLTGTPPGPGMAGWPPMSMESRSNGMSGRPADGDDAVLEVEPGRLDHDEPRARGGGERGEVDMRLVEAVLAAYQSGQHPRIGRVRLA